MTPISDTRPTLAALRYQLAELEQEKADMQYSDAPLWTNGTRDRLLSRIYALKEEIARRLGGNPAPA